MSGSAPRFPTRMTLLTPPAMDSSILVSRFSFAEACVPRSSDRIDGDIHRAMYRRSSIGVAIPAFNEARAIADAVATLPHFIDLAIVVDDASTDDTAARARASSGRAEVISHPQNRGVGAAI